MKTNNSKGQLTAQINLGDIPKAGFKLQYPFRGTGRLGRIYNTRCTRVFPSSKLAGKGVAAVQFEPLAVPILANMYVKQENFYVPENILWENFDKFISAGEMLDYEGKVPSMSLSMMMEHFLSFMTDREDVIPFSLPLVKGEVGGTIPFTELRLQPSVINDLMSWKFDESMRNTLDNLQMLDLFLYMEDVAHELGRYLLNVLNAETEDVRVQENNEIALFTRGYYVPTGSSAPADVKLLWNDNQPNRYLRKMYKSVVAAYDNAAEDGLQYLIPTDTGMAVLRYMYELIKPFFGYSSYLDNLGYDKIVFDNFVYCAVLSFIRYGSLGVYEGNIFLSMANMKAYLSEQPRSILPLRAQYCVWWNNYRDQLLEAKAKEPAITDAITELEVVTLLAPRVRCWHKDTFTTALDNPGTGMVGVPTNSVFSAGNNTSYVNLANFAPYVYGIDKINDLGDNAANLNGVFGEQNSIVEVSLGDKKWKVPTGFISGLSPIINTDDMPFPTSNTNGFSLYALDAARRAQKWLQKSLFYGNRIQDFLWTRFSVKYLDARLRLPELLSTSNQLVQLTDVINNTNVKSEDGTVAIAGDRAAIAHAFDKEGGYSERWCEEHGFMITNFTVMPDTTIANSLNRDLAMLDQFDYPFPDFATLGMDAVYDVELAQRPVKIFSDEALQGSDAAKVFGYQGRYYSVKSHLGEEHGELLDTQDMYTFARDFNIYDPDQCPKLNYIFVHCHPVLDMFVVDNSFSDYFRFDIFFDYDADHPFPVHSLYVG